MMNRSIEIFICVARNLNFTKAAEEFYTTQPTISRYIKILEEEVGFSIFVRNTKDVRLTPGGMILLEHCIEWKEAWENAVLTAKKIEDGKEGVLRIACFDTMDLSNDVFELICEMERQYPNIQVCLEKCSFRKLRDKFHSKEVDLVFTLNFERKNYKYAECRDVQKLVTGFIISNKHPLYKKESLKVEDFNEISFALPMPEDVCGREEELKEVFGHLGLKKNSIQFVDSMESMLMYVRSGKGAALIGEECEYVHDQKNFHFLPIEELYGHLRLMVVWDKDNLNPLVKVFANSLSKMM